MNNLRARVLAILIAAAAPAILLVTLLAYWTYEAGKDAAFDALGRDVDLMATRFDAVPVSAGRQAFMLAAAMAWDSRLQERCADHLSAALANFPGYSGAMIYRDGLFICARNSPISMNRTNELAAERAGSGKPLLGMLPDGAGEPILYAAATVPEENHAVTAILTVDPDFFSGLLALFRSFDSSKAWLVDSEGRSLAPPRGPDPDRAAALRAAALPQDQSVSFASDSSSTPAIIAARRLAGADLWLVTRQGESDVLASARNQLALAVLAPMVTLFVVGLAVWLGLTQFVIRWINRLIGATRAYSEGDLGARVGEAARAPSEIRELAQRFDGLADRMAERAVELEREVLQKRRYIRELHHRVKNNLQVIASLLSLQKRDLPPAQRAVLRFPEDRVNAMAAAFGVSYAQTESGDVGLLSIVREVITRLRANADGGHPRIAVKIAGEEQQVDLDMAIAVAMLLAELLPRYFDASVATDGDATIEASLQDRSLRITASGSPAEAATKLSHRFARAYLRQLDAELDEAPAGGLNLTIPLKRRVAAFDG